MPSIVHAVCPHDCPDSCGMLITVDDIGRATKIQGDPDHPVTRGFLCAKVAKYLSRVYSPDRVLYPLRRKPGTSKGTAAFERITWDEALNTISSRLHAIAAEFGPESILPYSYAGTTGALGYGSMDRRFFHRLGASQLDRTICATAGGEALISVYGRKFGTDIEAFAEAKYIIAWGANIHGNNVHLWPFIEEARRKGAKLVVIDPYLTRTAKCADWYLPINPGTDVALAMSMMHVIISEDLIDTDYIARAAEGYDELKAIVTHPDYAPESVAPITGISAADIRTLAREYATTTPAAIRVNYGLQRTDNGGSAVRAVAMLPVITGQWRHYGGGVQLSLSGAFALNQQNLTRPDLMRKALGRDARIVNMSELGSALTQLNGPPVKTLFVYNSNPAVIAPDQSNVLRGLMREDLFTVVHEQFLTDTTSYADIVLPATTFFEHKELQTAYGHYYLQLSHPAIAPLGEARDNVTLFRDLAHKMGFDDPCFSETHDQMIEGALQSADPALKGITRERLEREHRIRLNLNGAPAPSRAIPAQREPSTSLQRVADNAEDSEIAIATLNDEKGKQPRVSPFADGKFPTSSGRALLKNPALADIGVHPVLAYRPNPESRHRPVAGYPLEMLARKADNYLNSTFCNLPGLRPLEQNHLLEIHEAEAAPRNIRDGDPVRVFNARGSIELTAKVYPAEAARIQPGVVASRLNWNQLSPDGKGLNQLTPERLTDIGRGPVFYACLVEVEKR